MRATRNAIKRMIAVCLTAVMMLAMTATALATEKDVLPLAGTQQGSLTVKVNQDVNTLKGQSLFLYKLFDLSTNGTNYAYTVNSKYEDILKEVLSLGSGSLTSDDYYNAISKLNGQKEQLQKFADDFTEKAALASSSLTADYEAKQLEEKAEHTFNDVDYGYYLVYQTGTKEFQSSLVSVKAQTNEVDLKGEAPSIKKEANAASVEIGQVITYTITGTIPDTTGYDSYVYKISDTLTDGLDFVKDEQGTEQTDENYEVTVKITGKEPGSKMTATLSGDGNRKMELNLSDWVKQNQTDKGSEFTVTYYAKVNRDAVVETNNKAELEYGNKPGETTTTKPSQVNTPTYPLQIHKMVKGQQDGYLKGAKFRLYESQEDAANKQNPIGVTGSAGSYTVDRGSQTFDMESVENELVDGKMNLKLNGLKAGEYWLVETEPPAGYNGITAPIKITITDSASDNVNDWEISKDDKKEDDKIIDIENSTGTVLPETGGMGTVLFTVAAVAMIAGVAISFIRSRRSEE